VTGAGLERKHCGAGAGWEGVWGGLELGGCGAGEGTISKIPGGARAGRQQKKFNPCRTPMQTHIILK